MRFAICDDCERDRKRIYDILRICFRGDQMEAVEFENGQTLLKYAEKYDVIILDIEMPGMSGIEIKEKLQWSTRSIIIFVTSHEQMSKETHGLNVYGFVEKSKLEKQLSHMLEKLKQAWIPHIILDSDIDSRDVEYICAENVYTLCHMVSGGTRLIRISLEDMENKLRDYDFFQIHRSYLVNLKHIEKMKQGVVVMRSGELPVSVRRRKQFQEVYEKFCRKNARFG